MASMVIRRAVAARGAVVASTVAIVAMVLRPVLSEKHISQYDVSSMSDEQLLAHVQSLWGKPVIYSADKLAEILLADPSGLYYDSSIGQPAPLR